MRILSVFGTRPEAIKMAPVIKALAAESGLQPITCVTGQHRQMLDQVLELFGIKPDHDLSVMTPNQTLNGLSGRVIEGLDAILADEKPDYVLTHGDTTTAMAASLAAFHRNIPVGHVEAGLRTYDLSKPWPEEFNRRTNVSCVFLLPRRRLPPTGRNRRMKRLPRSDGAPITRSG
ncbi:UDP-N-acetylglucosamine 2-epimerase [Nitratireductor aquimarinus]|uniref:UDP-N-acetylglucosamine 2-epimerase n=1 Tax=Nitratireductor aquimarinus TaxID=889300 RepID=UPI001A8C4677|nr:UDP-N-acetylglucosamine 2-epimerase [Nitratireductor aquimarinus]MBN8243577.1 UDP-N-acetylglucosamine 2-epimerase [Nitratireductor aquimarinus]MBY6132294.1 UDP-N-acetylglucosamine 2-epimerase [Nitratireductor aquimarinus]